MDLDIRGRSAVITGASKGIGRAVAERLAAEGVNVYLVARTVTALETAASELKDRYGVDVGFSALDLSVSSNVDQLFAEYSGTVDILVNNAAIIVPRVEIENTSADSWDRVFEVNAKSVFLGTKHCIPAMRESGGGSIVNISSVAGIAQAYHQEPAYAASKGAVRIFSKVTAAQHAKDSIRCNSVHPGPIDTEMLNTAFADEEAKATRLTRVPMQRMGTAEEVAKGVLYLASDDSSYVTGSELVIDGGAIVM